MVVLMVAFVTPPDIVRDLVRSRLGGVDGGGIRAKQRSLVAAFVSACAADDWAADGPVAAYAELALEQHMLEGLFENELDDTGAHEWLLHTNELIVKNAATALGSATLQALSAAKEQAGDLVGAARVAWAARSVRSLPGSTSTDLMYRTAAA